MQFEVKKKILPATNSQKQDRSLYSYANKANDGTATLTYFISKHTTGGKMTKAEGLCKQDGV